MELLQYDSGELLSAKETTALVQSIRRKIEDTLGSGAQSARRIKEEFANIDVDNSGTINKQELIDAMQALRVRLKAHEASSILEKFGDGKSGEMRYKVSRKL
jgi:Ca2+-binding EF-hand superfamily protein